MELLLWQPELIAQEMAGACKHRLNDIANLSCKSVAILPAIHLCRPELSGDSAPPLDALDTGDPLQSGHNLLDSGAAGRILMHAVAHQLHNCRRTFFRNPAQYICRHHSSKHGSCRQAVIDIQGSPQRHTQQHISHVLIHTPNSLLSSTGRTLTVCPANCYPA